MNLYIAPYLSDEVTHMHATGDSLNDVVKDLDQILENQSWQINLVADL